MLAGLLLHRVRCGGAAWRRLALPETSRMSTDAARRDEERVGKSATRRRRATLPTLPYPQGGPMRLKSTVTLQRISAPCRVVGGGGGPGGLWPTRLRRHSLRRTRVFARAMSRAARRGCAR